MIMPEGIFHKLARHFADKGDTDNPNMDIHDVEAEKFGVDKRTGRTAFWTGRALKSLRESELLDGGDCSEANSVDLEELSKSTLSLGDKKKK